MRVLAAWVWLVLASVAGAQERSIDKEIVIAAPIDAVWTAWTSRAGIESFFAPEAEIDAQVGGAFHIHIDPFGAPGMKGADDMRFMALQKPTMLSFDWNAPPSQPEVRRQRTFVVVRLADIDGRSTRVRLHHTGWGDGGEWDRDLHLLRPRLGQRARQPEEALRDRADRLDRLARAAEEDARGRHGEEAVSRVDHDGRCSSR